MGFAFRRSIVILLAAAMVAPLSPWVASAGGAAGPPTWSVGDYWDYAGIRVEPGPNVINVTLRYEVVGVESVEVGAGTVRTYRLDETRVLGDPPVSVEETAVLWRAVDDLALIRERFDYSSVVIAWTYDPPLPLAVWPLEVGAGWDVESTWTVGGDVAEYGGPWTTSGTILREREVEVPAGSFETFQISRGSYWFGDFAPDVGHLVQWNWVDNWVDNGPVRLRFQLAGYRYANAPPDLSTFTWILLGGVTAAVAAVVALGLRPPRPRGPQHEPVHVFHGGDS